MAGGYGGSPTEFYLPGYRCRLRRSTLSFGRRNAACERTEQAHGPININARDSDLEGTPETAIGLETGSAASDYIQLWNEDAQLLTESLAYIRLAASQILPALTEA